MRLRLLLWITAGSHCLITPYALTAQGTTRAPAFDSIREVDLRTDVAFLSADGMQGRRADTDGNRLASEFIASRFVKEIALMGGDISSFVSASVAARIAAKVAESAGEIIM